MWKYYEGYGMGWYPMEWLGMLLFILIPILLVIVMVKYLSRGKRATPADKDNKLDALALIGERYARGVMDRDEYLQKFDDLKRR